MFHKVLSFGGMLALAGAVFMWTAGPADARGGGGGGHGGGGGGHGGGGFHGGGGHYGGFGGGYGGFHGGGHYGGGWGGYHGGYGAYHNYGYGHYGHHDGYGHHYHHYYPWGYGYGLYPYGGYYGSYPYYDNYSYDYSDVGSDSGYGSAYSGADAPPIANVAPATSSATAKRPIHLTVNVPADAQVWVEDTKTTSTGPVREFQSPPVTPGERYTYKVQARWNENGHEVTQTQEVKVIAGAHIDVNFPAPAATAEPKTAGE